jgi:hypothetical protein
MVSALFYIIIAVIGLVLISIPVLLGIGIYLLIKHKHKGRWLIASALVAVLVLFFSFLIYWWNIQPFVDPLPAKENCAGPPYNGEITRFDEACPTGMQVHMKQFKDVEDGYKCCVPEWLCRKLRK